MSKEPKNVNVQVFQFSLGKVVELLKNEQFIFETPYEMSDFEKSKVIENIFLKMPLLSGVFVENYPMYTVLLGKVIIETIFSFVVLGDFKLSGLEFFSELNGLSFSELPLRWKRYITECIWTVYVVQSVKKDVIENIMCRYSEMFNMEG